MSSWFRINAADNYLHVIVKKLGNTVATAEVLSELYCLKTQCAQANLVTPKKHSDISSDMWHKRLWQWSLWSVSEKKPFSRSQTTTNKLLELVHMDLCKPIEICSVGGDIFNFHRWF